MDPDSENVGHEIGANEDFDRRERFEERAGKGAANGGELVESREEAHCRESTTTEPHLSMNKSRVGCQLMEKDRRQLQMPALLTLFDGCLKYLQPMG